MGKLKGVSILPDNFSHDEHDGSGVIIGDFEKSKSTTAQTSSAYFAPLPSGRPVLGEAAYHGLVGQIVHELSPETEASPAGILVQTLILLGNIIGQGPYFKVGSTRHHVNLSTILCGQTAKSRKGMSFDHAVGICREVDPVWAKNNIKSGLSSGEGLIYCVRDPLFQDPGVSDKRLLVLESEFSSPLKMLERPGNSLSPVIRNAWDNGNLQILNKNSPAQATGAHVSIIGHITREELLKNLKSSDAGTGFANRFLYCWVTRTRCLPEGGSIPEEELAPLTARLKENVETIKVLGDIRIEFDEEARALWRRIYSELSMGKPGLLGAVTARGEAQAVRLASLYALLDFSLEIKLEHLRAALCLWDYCEASARHIFGDKSGDPVADQILAGLRSRKPEGMSRTGISSLFKRHQKATEINQALSLLQSLGLAEPENRKTKGRDAEEWFAL